MSRSPRFRSAQRTLRCSVRGFANENRSHPGHPAGIPGPGRRLNDLTFGVNWYVNGFTKFQFNYIRAFLNDPTNGRSDANIVALRTQIDF